MHQIPARCNSLSLTEKSIEFELDDEDQVFNELCLLNFSLLATWLLGFLCAWLDKTCTAELFIRTFNHYDDIS